MSTPTAPYRVVLVDDAADLRLLVGQLLERDGRFAVVGQAADGAEGIRTASEHQPDLCVLDLSMPVMDGLEALPRILEECPTTKVVILSGLDAGQMEATALRLGAAGYLEKGAAFARLADMLAEIAAG
ncbi:MAG: response regulator [Actinobacteria bacterium]|nr:response regulator [Actinomycetota bacterium]